MPKYAIRNVINPITKQKELGKVPLDKWAKEEITKHYKELGYQPIGVNDPNVAVVGIDTTQKV